MRCVKVEHGIVVKSAIWKVCPDDWIESSAGMGWAYSNGEFSPPEKEDPTGSELAELAQSEMITELNWCDLQIKLHTSSDKRAVSTLDDVYAYARSCRDYVQNVDGELTIIGDKPVRSS